MCTVTLVPLKTEDKGFILTSNRDEAAQRIAIPPKFYKEGGVELFYPKDKEGGGSWIGLSRHSRLICLLNGGYEDHIRKAAYRMSRGVVLKDLLVATNLNKTLETYDLKGIEPFTIILVDWKKDLRFMEVVWDGEEKHVKELDKTNHLWSSSPLYTPEMKKLRENWFGIFQEKEKISPESIWKFHHTGGIGDNHVDVIMDRGFVKTQSISQVVKNKDNVIFTYEDLSTSNILKEIISKDYFK